MMGQNKNGSPNWQCGPCHCMHAFPSENHHPPPLHPLTHLHSCCETSSCSVCKGEEALWIGVHARKANTPPQGGDLLGGKRSHSSWTKFGDIVPPKS